MRQLMIQNSTSEWRWLSLDRLKSSARMPMLCPRCQFTPDNKPSLDSSSCLVVSVKIVSQHAFDPWLECVIARRCLIFFLCTTIVAFGQSSAPKDQPLKFLIILIDDLGFTDLGCYGNTENKTPNIDRLAAEGTRFEMCFATPNCTPSRVLLLTGQYGFRTGWFSLIGRPYSPRPDSPDFNIGKKVTFAKLLKSRGYATSLSGKWQLPGELPNLIWECGFDEYRMWAYRHNLPPGSQYTVLSQARNPDKTSRYWQPCIVENGKFIQTGPNDYGPDSFNQFTIDFIGRNRDKPFCAYYPSVLTHRPHVDTPDPADPAKRIPGDLKSNVEYLDMLVGKM